MDNLYVKNIFSYNSARSYSYNIYGINNQEFFGNVLSASYSSAAIGIGNILCEIADLNSNKISKVISNYNITSPNKSVCLGNHIAILDSYFYRRVVWADLNNPFLTAEFDGNSIQYYIGTITRDAVNFYTLLGSSHNNDAYLALTDINQSTLPVSNLIYMGFKIATIIFSGSYNNYIYFINNDNYLHITDKSKSTSIFLNGDLSYVNFKDKIFFYRGNDLYYFSFSTFNIVKYLSNLNISNTLTPSFVGNLLLLFKSGSPSYTISDCYDVSDFNNPQKINSNIILSSTGGNSVGHPYLNNVLIFSFGNYVAYFYVGTQPYSQSGMYDNHNQLVNSGYTKFNIRNMARPVSVLGKYKS